MAERDLEVVVENDDLRAFKRLIKGDDVKIITIDGAPVLFYAAGFGSQRITHFLIRKGVDINARSDSGLTALHYAIMRDEPDLDAVMFLVAKGADVNASDHRGNTVLHVASQMCSLEVVTFLYTNGAYVNAINDLGKTALHFAIERDEPQKIVKIVRFLVSKCADVDARDRNDETPLHLACKFCKDKPQILDAVERLIDAAECSRALRESCNFYFINFT